MDIRLNIYDEKKKWVGQEYLTEEGQWLHRWTLKGKLEIGSWRGRAKGENELNWKYKRVLVENAESEGQANELLPLVIGSSDKIVIELSDEELKIVTRSELEQMQKNALEFDGIENWIVKGMLVK